MFKQEFSEGESQAWNAFKEWLMTKDPKEEYSWSSPSRCAAGQFCEAIFKEKKRDYSHIRIYGRISDFAHDYRTFGQLQKALA